MDFKITKNNKLHIKKINMNTDHVLNEHFCEPLDTFRSGFCALINGPSGSGKTNLLINLMSNKSKKNIPQSFRGCFDNIFVVSPSLHTILHNPFENLEHIYDELNDETIEKYYEMLEEGDKNDSRYLLIFDDVADDIKSKEVYKKILKIINKRRHLNTSIFILSQNIIQIPPSIRKNLSHIFTFKLKTIPEKEKVYEYTGKPKKYMDEFYEFVFNEKYMFLLIDLSMKRCGNNLFYKCFDRIEF
jgi:GTPase SAR1 family protein